MTELLYRDDPYLTEAAARVTAASDAGVELDRTIFYAASGGQPGDSGRMEWPGGGAAVTDTLHPDGDRTRVLHRLDAPAPPPGTPVRLVLDWARRHRLMRMHTALHLLSVVLPYGVTGGQIGEDKGRLDFDMPEPPGDLAAIDAALNAHVAADMAVSAEWIGEDELAARPEMVKTMKVKPPVGQGRVRLVRIGEVDLQPCGGTHVARTGEIGPLRLGKIEKKGRENRRVSLHFADGAA
ncbi:MAG: alanyl-tRNA editing protein [Amaricoccus sp.]|uniref:alanyl-tRNA editing protein n=1 Tax=Amaricoccus sp. TaxID=1872485 RepID=UPI0039E2148A